MGRIKTDDSNSRKDIIVTKAAILFRDKGFKSASMRELAEMVGVEAASLYNHIKNKNELLHEICTTVANRYNNNMDLLEKQQGDSLKKIEQLLRFHINGMVEHFEEVYVSDHEWKFLSEPYFSEFREQRRNYRQRFAGIIQAGIDKGEIKPIDPTTAVLVMLHAISGIASWHRSQQKISGQELEENMITILTGGLHV